MYARSEINERGRKRERGGREREERGERVWTEREWRKREKRERERDWREGGKILYTRNSETLIAWRLYD